MMKLLGTQIESSTGTGPIMDTGVGPIISLRVTAENIMNGLTKQLHTVTEQLTAICSPVWFTIVRNYDRTQTAFGGTDPI